MAGRELLKQLLYLADNDKECNDAGNDYPGALLLGWWGLYGGVGGGVAVYNDGAGGVGGYEAGYYGGGVNFGVHSQGVYFIPPFYLCAGAWAVAQLGYICMV